jgi:hypothetical protein
VGPEKGDSANPQWPMAAMDWHHTKNGKNKILEDCKAAVEKAPEGLISEIINMGYSF